MLAQLVVGDLYVEPLRLQLAPEVVERLGGGELVLEQRVAILGQSLVELVEFQPRFRGVELQDRVADLQRISRHSTEGRSRPAPKTTPPPTIAVQATLHPTRRVSRLRRES